MTEKYYADSSGISLGNFPDGSSKIPTGAVITTGPPLNMKNIWNVTTQLWDGDLKTWTEIRDIRKPLKKEAINKLDKYRNQLLRTGGGSDIDTAKATEWADYLQILRDIPDLSINTSWNGPDDVVWPTKPT